MSQKRAILWATTQMCRYTLLAPLSSEIETALLLRGKVRKYMVACGAASRLRLKLGETLEVVAKKRMMQVE
jgi:hypothetical protein